MKFKIKLLLSIFIIVISLGFGYGISYYLYKPKSEENDILKNDQKIVVTDDFFSVDKPQTNVISEKTKIVYEYFYKDLNKTETFEDIAPYFIIGMDRDETQKYFYDWQLKSFSENQVILQKVIQDEEQIEYYIGEHNGFVAVFSSIKMNEKTLINITKRPVESLNLEEQFNVKKGFKVKDKKELINYLENYES